MTPWGAGRGLGAAKRDHHGAQAASDSGPMPRAFAPRAHAARKAVAPRDPAADGWLHKLGAFVKLLQEVFKFASPVVISRSWEGFLLWQVWPALCGASDSACNAERCSATAAGAP